MKKIIKGIIKLKRGKGEDGSRCMCCEGDHVYSRRVDFDDDINDTIYSMISNNKLEGSVMKVTIEVLTAYEWPVIDQKIQINHPQPIQYWITEIDKINDKVLIRTTRDYDAPDYNDYWIAIERVIFIEYKVDVANAMQLVDIGITDDINSKTVQLVKKFDSDYYEVRIKGSETSPKSLLEYVHYDIPSRFLKAL